MGRWKPPPTTDPLTLAQRETAAAEEARIEAVHRMEHAQRALRKAETELHNLHEKHDDEVHKWDARHDHLQRRFDSLRKRKNELLMESDVSYHFADTLMQAAALAWADTVAPDAYDSDAHRDAFDEKYEELMVLREATYKRIKAQYKDPVTDD